MREVGLEREGGWEEKKGESLRLLRERESESERERERERKNDRERD
jgi:hypothetical protein